MLTAETPRTMSQDEPLLLAIVTGMEQMDREEGDSESDTSASEKAGSCHLIQRMS